MDCDTGCFAGFGQSSFLQDYGDLDNAKTRVEQLELDHGQNSFILAEPLAELAQLYTEHGRYDEAYRALDRATLIIRRDKGLYTREQIPFLQKKIENFAASLDWENARGRWITFIGLPSEKCNWCA